MIPLGDSAGRAGWTWVCWGLAALWLGAIALGLAGAGLQGWHDALRLEPGPARRALGEAAGWWSLRALPAALPLGGHALVCGGTVQAVLCAVFLPAFGRRLESRAGALRFLCFAAAAVLAGGVAEVLAGGPASRAGGNALVSACAAGLLVLHPRLGLRWWVPVVLWPVRVELPLWFVAVGWAVLQWGVVTEPGRLWSSLPPSLLAHLAGAATGAALAPIVLD